jgi:hypothetical protein
MECHDARILLTFVERKSEAVDAAERAALQQHLDLCPDCAARAHAERQADEALGKLMLDVPVPADLQGKLLKRLAQQRPSKAWRWAAAAMIGAVVVIASGIAGSVWYATRPPLVTFEDVTSYQGKGFNWKADDVESDFNKSGITMRVPGEFKPSNLQRVEIVEFKNRRVARLEYRGISPDGATAIADVLVLPNRQFRADQLPKGGVPGGNLTIIRHEDYTYLIMHNGRLVDLFRGTF